MSFGYKRAWRSRSIFIAVANRQQRDTPWSIVDAKGARSHRNSCASPSPVSACAAPCAIYRRLAAWSNAPISHPGSGAGRAGASAGIHRSGPSRLAIGRKHRHLFSRTDRRPCRPPLRIRSMVAARRLVFRRMGLAEKLGSMRGIRLSRPDLTHFYNTKACDRRTLITGHNARVAGVINKWNGVGTNASIRIRKFWSR